MFLVIHFIWWRVLCSEALFQSVMMIFFVFVKNSSFTGSYRALRFFSLSGLTTINSTLYNQMFTIYSHHISIIINISQDFTDSITNIGFLLFDDGRTRDHFVFRIRAVEFRIIKFLIYLWFEGLWAHLNCRFLILEYFEYLKYLRLGLFNILGVDILCNFLYQLYHQDD